MEWVTEYIEEFQYVAIALVLFLAGLGAYTRRHSFNIWRSYGWLLQVRCLNSLLGEYDFHLDW